MYEFLLQVDKSTFLRVISVFFVILCLRGVSNGEEKAEHNIFYHDVFGYGRIPQNERDPTLPLTDAESVMVRGEGYEYLKPMDGLPYVEYLWSCVGIVRAIGYQKDEQWIEVMIDRVSKIYWPKSSVEHTEIVYPCIWALARIGEPSVEPILKSASSSRDLFDRKLLARALEGIRGEAGAEQLLKERGIDIDKPVEESSRRIKRAVSGELESRKKNSEAIKIISGKKAADFSTNRRQMIFVVFAFLMALGILIIWRLKKLTFQGD